MKHSHRARTAPREIHVRMSAPRPASELPDVWVVNGRVIRFLDPSRPEVDSTRLRVRRFDRLRTLAHR